ncbi:MAG: hypothetical protein ABIH53_02125 [archaeon]
MIKKSIMALMAVVGLSCCRDKYYRISDECYTSDNLVHNSSSGIEFFVPGDYQEDVVDYTLYSRRFSALHPNSDNLREVIFYDPSLCELPKKFEESSAISNSVDTIWMNDPEYLSKSLDGEVQRYDFFYDLLGGPDHVLGHEYAHILFQHMLEEMCREDFNGLASEDYELSDDLRSHYIVDSYSRFIEIMHARDYVPEGNRYFERDIVPVVRKRPDLIWRARIIVNSWNLDSLRDSALYHDNQLDFFIGLGAINSVYRDMLSKENVFPFMYGLLEIQKVNALDELDMIENP